MYEEEVIQAVADRQANTGTVTFPVRGLSPWSRLYQQVIDLNTVNQIKNRLFAAPAHVSTGTCMLKPKRNAKFSLTSMTAT